MGQQNLAKNLQEAFPTLKSLPNQFGELPDEAKLLVKDILNKLSEDGLNEQTINAAAWGAVEREWQKLDDGTWIRKENTQPQFNVKTTTKKGPLRIIKLRTDFEGAAQSEVQVFKTGKFVHDFFGSFEITKDMLKEMVQQFNSSDRDICVDFNHGSLDSDPDSCKAGGWVRELSLRDRGKEMWALIDWTEFAREKIEAGEFRFISPEWTEEARDKETGEILGPQLLAVALTNRPFLEGMAPVKLTEIPLKRGQKMKLVSKIKEKLNLSENASDEDILAAIDKNESVTLCEIEKVVEASEGETVLQAIKRKLSEGAESKKAVEEITKALEDEKTTTKELKDKMIDVEAGAFADRVILTEKKATPAQRDSIVKMYKSMGVKATSNFFSTSKQLDHFKTFGKNDDNEGAENLTEEEIKVAEKLGVDVKYLSEYKNKLAKQAAN